MLRVRGVALAAALLPAIAFAEPTFVQTARGALVVWTRSDGEVVAQALDANWTPTAGIVTVAAADETPRPAAVVASRVNGAWVVVSGADGPKAHRLDAAGAAVGAPWDLGIEPGLDLAVTGDDRTLYLAVRSGDDVRVRRWVASGNRSGEILLPLARGHRLLGIAVSDRDLHVATTADDGPGLAVRTLPRTLEDPGGARSVEVGGRWSSPRLWGRGAAVVAAGGSTPVAALFLRGRVRTVEVAGPGRIVEAAVLAPWAGAGWTAWTTSADPLGPVAAIRALDPSASPTGRTLCARGFPGARLAGLLAIAQGAAAAWTERTATGAWRIATSRPGEALRWIAGERVEALGAGGVVPASEISSDGTVRLSRRVSVVLPELAGAARPAAARASIGRETIVAYTAVVDGRRRVRVIRVDRAGRATTPRTVSGAAGVEAPVSIAATPAGFVVGWIEEQGRSVVVAETTIAR